MMIVSFDLILKLNKSNHLFTRFNFKAAYTKQSLENIEYNRAWT